MPSSNKRERVVRAKPRGAVQRGSGSQPRVRLRLWIGVGIAIAALVILGGAISMAQQGGEAAPAGQELVAERTAHDFGQVRIGGGNITTRFPLSVRGASLVAKLESN